MAIDFPTPEAKKYTLPSWNGRVPDSLFSHFGLTRGDADYLTASMVRLEDGSYAATFWWIKNDLVQDGRRETYGNPKVQNKNRTVNDYPDTSRLLSVINQFGIDENLSPLPKE